MRLKLFKKTLLKIAPWVFFTPRVFADYRINMPAPETIIAHQIYSLNTYVLLICAVIFVFVFGWMFIALLKHRKSVGHEAKPFHENMTVEIIWSIVPFFILVALAYPATETVLAMKDASNSDMSIKITAYQWRWKYEYPKEGIQFYSNLATPRSQIEGFNNDYPKGSYLLEVDHPMVVPVGKKVRLLVTSADVIHSWYVPAFGVNQYGIPGFIKETWIQVDKPGTYKGQCNQICGKEHAYMPITVVAYSPTEYQAWVEKNKKEMAAAAEDPNKIWSFDELNKKGAQVFAANCQVCHQSNGMGVAGSFPALNRSLIVLGPKAGQIDRVLHGKGAMPAWGSQLKDSEIAAVITYTRNAWDNHLHDEKSTEGMVQPSEIKAARG